MTTEQKPLGVFARVAVAVGVGAVASAGLTLAMVRAQLPTTATALLAASFAALLGPTAAAIACGRFARRLKALHDGLLSFSERDFGVRVTPGRPDAVGVLIDRFNRLGDLLRAERNEVYQKERLLETVLDTAPMAVLLIEEGEAGEGARVAYSNGAARDLFARGRGIDGERLEAVLAVQPKEMRAAIASGEDVLFTVARAGERETFHASTRRFDLRARQHTLILVKPLTREVTRRETFAYKNAVRIISHELNNSLAPISSLVHSGRKLIDDHPHSARLARVFETVAERVTHLGRFLESYAQFAKLPRPDPRPVEWSEFVEGVRSLYPCRLRGPITGETSIFDPAQMQQVVINLLKNATEAGSAPEDVELDVVSTPEMGFEIWVLDRGSGMTDEALAQAAMPFYSTKQTGSGIGLALCREIVEAHGGELSLHRREGGGIAVCCVVPGPSQGGARSA